MKPASAPRAVSEQRILVVDAVTGRERVWAAASFADLVEPGDLVVVNDAATLPASLHGHTASGAPIELRLASAPEEHDRTLRFTAALLGAGDYRTRTEERPLPPDVAPGDVLTLGERLVARVVAISSISRRLVDVELSATTGPVWPALYRAGRPVQYAHVPVALSLWDVQNVFAGRPWAVEMPSAGRVLRGETLLALRARGVELATITHAAGLSATGDAAIDARLPLPERFEVTAETAAAVLRTRSRGGRVLAVGTSVVRALESAARAAREAGSSSPIVAASGVTDLLLHPGARRAVVDGLVTGVHESDTTHFTLLGAFAERGVLDHALRSAEEAGLLGHELGDAWLVWGAPATPLVAQRDRASPVTAGCSSFRCASSATVAA